MMGGLIPVTGASLSAGGLVSPLGLHTAGSPLTRLSEQESAHLPL